ncbi:MAG: proline--tRNA ligase [Alphaproteobacteria bacterium]|nr:proline--tRNA ligase [Alphaproteobacteria bacterium]
MKMSEYFLPTLKEDPAEAAIISHRYMLRAGLIRQSVAGIYHWLPLGFKVLKKIEQIVREEQDNAGFHEILMPTIQPAEMWQQSGRYDGYGKEMLRIKDRNDRDLLYGPTNEEVITDIFRQSVTSYKELPLILYHIQWKFRDEIRPRFGVMRGREFLMKDAYSFDKDDASAEQTYYRIFASYLRIFARLGLKPIPMRAETGPIGGDKSHEFIVLAETGESTVYCHQDLLDYNPLDIKADDDKQQIFEDWTKLYAATEDMHEADKFNQTVPKDKQIEARGIEVGHIFYFGDKYSIPLKAEISLPDGTATHVKMGSYGVGVSRMVGALVEAFHDDKGIIWPQAVAPFDIALINLAAHDNNPDADKINALCEDLFNKSNEMGVELLYDDRDERVGRKFADHDLIGLPYQLIIGTKALKNNSAELKNRKTGVVEAIPLDNINSVFDRIIQEKQAL